MPTTPTASTETPQIWKFAVERRQDSVLTVRVDQDLLRGNGPDATTAFSKLSAVPEPARKTMRRTLTGLVDMLQELGCHNFEVHQRYLTCVCPTTNILAIVQRIQRALTRSGHVVERMNRIQQARIRTTAPASSAPARRPRQAPAGGVMAPPQG